MKNTFFLDTKVDFKDFVNYTSYGRNADKTQIWMFTESYMSNGKVYKELWISCEGTMATVGNRFEDEDKYKDVKTKVTSKATYFEYVDSVDGDVIKNRCVYFTEKVARTIPALKDLFKKEEG